MYFKHTKNLVFRKKTNLGSLNIPQVYSSDWNTKALLLMHDPKSMKTFPQSSMGLWLRHVGGTIIESFAESVLQGEIFLKQAENEEKKQNRGQDGNRFDGKYKMEWK